MKTSIHVWLAGLALSISPMIQADITLQGDDELVNTQTQGQQYFPRTAAAANGNFVISYNESNAGINNSYIKLFDNSGQTIRQLNFAGGTTSFSINDVAMNAYGQFAAVFSDSDNAYVQLYNADGSPRFGQFIRLNTDQTQRYFADSVAINDSGDVTVTWRGQSRTQYKVELYTRQLQFAGYWISNPVKIANDPYPGAIYQSSDVAMQANGDFVIAWTALVNNKVRAYKKDFYRGAAVKRNSTKVYDTSSVYVQGTVNVTQHPSNGDYYIAWSQLNTGYGSGNYWRVMARKYRASGSSTGGLIQVNETTSMWQPNIDALFDDAGLFVAWSAYINSDYDVYAKSYTPQGSIKSATTQLNRYTSSNQDFVQITRLGGNQLMATWVSNGQDGDGRGVYRQGLQD